MLEATLPTLAQKRPVIAVTGARQTGKTSLLRKVFPHYRFVSLDLPSEAELAEREPASFLARHPPPLIIDEVQYAPAIFRHLKHAVDEQRAVGGQFLLTGSQKLNFMKEVSESLAGRIEVLDLETLSLQEIRGTYPDLPLSRLLFRGGFPELYEKLDLEPTGFYRSYVLTYLERDLLQLIRVTQLRDFERFLRACALRTAQVLNKADLARDIGISPSTASEWLSALQASGQIELLEPWFSNRTKSLVKSPKLYLCDTGLLAFLLNLLSEEELLRSPLVGAIWETLVYAELRKRLPAHRGSLFFWRDRTTEVDFLLHRGGRFELMEAKWTETPDARDAAALARVSAALGAKNVVARRIYCRAASAYPLADGTRVEPLG